MKLILDTNRLIKLISSIRQSVSLLEELAGIEKEEFVNDPHKISSAKYNFIAAIEAAIDLTNHIISKNRFRAPQDYADSFRILFEEKLIDKKFSEELCAMARFRNRLVHLYWDIDNQQIRTILRTRLNDFEKFIEIISQSRKEG